MNKQHPMNNNIMRSDRTLTTPEPMIDELNTGILQSGTINFDDEICAGNFHAFGETIIQDSRSLVPSEQQQQQQQQPPNNPNPSDYQILHNVPESLLPETTPKKFTQPVAQSDLLINKPDEEICYATNFDTSKSSFGSSSAEESFLNIDQALDELVGEMINIIELIEDYREHHREFSSKLSDRREMEEDNQMPPVMRADVLAKLEGNIGKEENGLNLERNELIFLMNEIFSRVSKIQGIVLREKLKQWYHSQQQIGLNGDNDEERIKLLADKRIGNWMRSLIDLTWRLRNQMKKLRELSRQLKQLRKANGTLSQKQQQFSNLKILANRIDESFNELILSSFIITKQPPQVIKTNNRFDVEVQLVSDINCLTQEIKPIIEVVIVSETNVANLISHHDKIVKTCHSLQCSIGAAAAAAAANEQHSSPNLMMISKFKKGDLVGHEKHNLEYNETTKQVVCHFKRLKIKKITRSNDKSAMEEKYNLVFYCKLTLPHDQTESTRNPATTFHLLAISLPTIVIVCANQEALASATATWHYAFVKPGGPPYEVPDEVNWRNLAKVLGRKFESLASEECDVENNGDVQSSQKKRRRRGLDSGDLVYLLSIIKPDCENIRDDIRITWNQFAKDKLANKSFTFWEWFYSILKLTKDHLIEHWVANKIYGFSSKSTAAKLLSGGEFVNGTFLLRFSESMEGSISIVWKRSDTRIDHLLPCSSRELISRSIADRIGDDEALINLYPDRPKVEAFGPFHPDDQYQATHIGYIRIELRQIRLDNLKPMDH